MGTSNSSNISTANVTFSSYLKCFSIYANFMFLLSLMLLSVSYADSHTPQQAGDVSLPSSSTTTTTTTAATATVLGCDQVFVSPSLDSVNLNNPLITGVHHHHHPTPITITTKNGTFTSPTIIGNVDHQSRQCLYTFIAGENERVQITFSTFNLRGAHPECNHEFVDLYTELEDISQELITSPFGGRYCGRTVPRKRVSLHQILVIGFHTDQVSVDETIFQGSFEFIDASPFSQIGTPIPHTVCSFTIYVDQKREGQFRSPTYPGVYPKNLSCSYRFIGRKGQRVRLEFMDFDLFYGGSHCPFDYIKVYDGSSPEDFLIGTYCGQQRNLVIYSSGENLFVQFHTLQRTADSQNRGFQGWYEFSERYVNLGFIGKNDGEHILGTECDQKILSKKESNGTIYSPNYPFLYHTNIICKYFIYGLQDAQHLETVRLTFDKFEIPATDPNECNDAYLRVYLSGEGSLDEPDHIFCGTETPAPIISDGPILIMVFSSGSSQGQGFKAKYSFETDYKVQGTPDPPGCRFKYLSESSKTGDFNSPRHPANYPSSTDCTYDFYGQPGEQVKLVFNYFRLKVKDEVAVPVGYNDACTEDWIEVYEIFPSGREYKFGRYCGKSAPGPIVSDVGAHTMRVILSTDDAGVTPGFLANYHFLPAMTSLGDCGRNITGEEDGVISSPGYPAPYPPYRQICNWFITVRPKHRVLLFFEYFLIEGDPGERGCPSAVVRVWKELSSPAIELCGGGVSNETAEFISTGEMLRLSFITADKAVGSGGFKATWTSIRDPSPPPTSERQQGQPPCELFSCTTNGYCISPSLKCNGVHNCGKWDDSDEAGCIRKSEVNEFLLSAIVAAASMLVLLASCGICHRRRRRRKRTSSNGSVVPVPEPIEHGMDSSNRLFDDAHETATMGRDGRRLSSPIVEGTPPPPPPSSLYHHGTLGRSHHDFATLGSNGHPGHIHCHHHHHHHHNPCSQTPVGLQSITYSPSMRRRGSITNSSSNSCDHSVNGHNGQSPPLPPLLLDHPSGHCPSSQYPIGTAAQFDPLNSMIDTTTCPGGDEINSILSSGQEDQKEPLDLPPVTFDPLEPFPPHFQPQQQQQQYYPILTHQQPAQQIPSFLDTELDTIDQR